MSKEFRDEKDQWTNFLYFAYKKAKHFVTKETSFVDKKEIIKFEENLDENINKLANLLMFEDLLKKRINKMKGYLYFVPKSFGPNKEPRIRPKVAFPFEYQVLWAAVILRIGEWFDTNDQLKNIYSMRDDNLRKKLDWMVNWSFNGRIKRAASKISENPLKSSYIQYNDSMFYESHQLALRKYHTYESKVIEKLFKTNEKVYKAELDIHEFFPTLKKGKIKEMFSKRFKSLTEIKDFNERFFNPLQMERITKILLNLKIDYPGSIEKDDVIYKVLLDYQEKFEGDQEQIKKNEIKDLFDGTNIITKLLENLNKTLPLDLIASNFLSNCTLNHFVDIEIYFKRYQSDVYILRYTDDYAVISSNKEVVKKVIDDIKEKLTDIELSYSYEKTLPTNVKDIIERLNFIKKENNWNPKYFEEIEKWFEFNQYADLNQSLSDVFKNLGDELESKTLMFGIQIEPEEVDKGTIGNQLIISRLSSTSNINVQALTDEELKIYMQELMAYLQAKGDVGELKGETAKIFAAWRLNASYQEKAYRKKYEIADIKIFLSILEDAIVKYPYKFGFFDIYLLLLLGIIEETGTGYGEIESFLVNIRSLLEKSSDIVVSKSEKDENLEKILSVFLPAVRIRILNLMSNNWRRFQEDERVKLRSVLERTFLNWYASPKVYWEELYTMYSSFFIMRIRLPLDICEVELKQPKFLIEIAKAYNDYLFTPKNSSKEGKNEVVDKDESITIAIDLLKRGLYWDITKKEFVFNEIDQLIYQKLKEEIKLGNGDMYSKLSFAKIAPEKLKKDDWNSLTNINNKAASEFKFELYDFLQLNIQLYFTNPKRHSSILDWSEQGEEQYKSNEFLRYVRDRFSSYRKIRNYFSLTDERFSALRSERSTLDNEAIPIADWVFYCQTLPYHLETSSMKQKVLHPLTEYEFVKILKEISLKENKILDVNKNEEDSLVLVSNSFLLFKTQMNFKEWSELRSLDKKDQQWAGNNQENVDNNGVLEDTSKAEGTLLNTEKYAKLLFSLLTNRPWHIHVNKKLSMFKWNDLQSYFEMTYYPSTIVASLFVNHLNIHQNFYSYLYNMPLEELPYREIYTRERTSNIESWMKDYLERQIDNQVYKNDNRKLELLEINIDQLRG